MKITGKSDFEFRRMLSTSEQSNHVALHAPLKGMSHYGNYLEAMKNSKQASPLRKRVSQDFKEQKFRAPSKALKQAAQFSSGAHTPPLKKRKKS
jgi:hypothetical protein